MPVPLFVNCMLCVLDVPSVTLPKLTLLGVMVSAGCRPVPVTAITTLVPCEVATVTLPVTLSDAVGLNTTVSDAVCPAVRASGVVIPLVLTSLALTETCEMVRLVFPLLVMVTLFELELPAFTLPKLRLVGLAVSDDVAVTPVPLRDTAAGEFGALLVIDRLPVTAPADAGANFSVKLLDCPAVKESGSVNPAVLNPLPVTVA